MTTRLSQSASSQVLDEDRQFSLSQPSLNAVGTVKVCFLSGEELDIHVHIDDDYGYVRDKVAEMLGVSTEQVRMVANTMIGSEVTDFEIVTAETQILTITIDEIVPDTAFWLLEETEESIRLEREARAARKKREREHERAVAKVNYLCSRTGT